MHGHVEGLAWLTPGGEKDRMMGESADARRFRANLQGEIDSIATYAALAGMATQPEIAEVYRRLAGEERRHADLWRTRLRETGTDPATFPDRPGWRTRLLIVLARRFGPGLILPTLMEQEEADSGMYDNQPEATAAGLPGAERSHARVFAALAGSPRGALEGSAVAKLEGRRHRGGGNALRAAVLGANDGLVSNASLVMGVAGANLAASSILLTGLSGLLAGSLSMALGEWLSVQSARELNRNQIGLEAEELAAFPEEEATELELIYRAKGVPADEAKMMVARMISDRSSALDTLAREELGIDPEELGGSAWEAAITSFVLFSVGAIFPVAPYFALSGWTAVAVSVSLSVIALFVLGALITLMTDRNAWFSGGRQVVIGIAAAAITFVVGKLIGTAIG